MEQSHELIPLYHFPLFDTHCVEVIYQLCNVISIHSMYEIDRNSRERKKIAELLLIRMIWSPWTGNKYLLKASGVNLILKFIAHALLLLFLSRSVPWMKIKSQAYILHNSCSRPTLARSLVRSLIARQSKWLRRRAAFCSQSEIVLDGRMEQVQSDVSVFNVQVVGIGNGRQLLGCIGWE